MAQSIEEYYGQLSPGARAAFEYDSLWFWQSANNAYPSMEEAQRRHNQYPTTALRTTKDGRYQFSVVNGVVHRSYPAPSYIAISARLLVVYILVPLYVKAQAILDVLIVLGLSLLGLIVLILYYIVYEIIYQRFLLKSFLAIILGLYMTAMFLIDLFWSIMAGLVRVMVAFGVALSVVLCILLGGWSQVHLYNWTSWATPAFTGAWYYPIWLTRLKETFKSKQPYDGWGLNYIST
ncbi:hypothetical protein WAI453_009535 [Rhynchosporium graminicola]